MMCIVQKIDTSDQFGATSCLNAPHIRSTSGPL